MELKLKEYVYDGVKLYNVLIVPFMELKPLSL